MSGQKCEKCGAPMTPMIFSSFCSAECDRPKQVAKEDVLIVSKIPYNFIKTVEFYSKLLNKKVTAAVYAGDITITPPSGFQCGSWGNGDEPDSTLNEWYLNQLHQHDKLRSGAPASWKHRFYWTA